MSVYHSFRSPDDVTFKMASGQQSNQTPFRGMGKEELLRHSSKPFWVKLRMICVSIILLGWLSLIITVVALIFVYPKCRDKDARSWWQNDVMYRIYVRSFYDSNGDGNGDLKGIGNGLQILYYHVYLFWHKLDNFFLICDKCNMSKWMLQCWK